MSPNITDPGLAVRFQIYDFWEGNEFVLNVLIPLGIMMVTYWTVGTLFTIVDITGKPEAIVQYRIQSYSENNYPRVTPAMMWKVIVQVLFNQTVIAVPVIITCYYLKCWKGFDNQKELPSLAQIVLDLTVCILVEEFFFYYSHRFLHQSYVYKHYHKRHHEWISPIGISAIYCHPVEHALSNVLPVHMGPVAAGCSVASMWVWMVFATTYGVIVHSGYHLPWLASPEAHEFHHIKFNEFYGIIGILDWLHGTDVQFRQSAAFRNHKVLFFPRPLHRELKENRNTSKDKVS